jgi:hypothetical protein
MLFRSRFGARIFGRLRIDQMDCVSNIKTDALRPCECGVWAARQSLAGDDSMRVFIQLDGCVLTAR